MEGNSGQIEEKQQFQDIIDGKKSFENLRLSNNFILIQALKMMMAMKKSLNL